VFHASAKLGEVHFQERGKTGSNGHDEEMFAEPRKFNLENLFPYDDVSILGCLPRQGLTVLYIQYHTKAVTGQLHSFALRLFSWPWGLRPGALCEADFTVSEVTVRMRRLSPHWKLTHGSSNPIELKCFPR
jgi:hypothetical protein